MDLEEGEILLEPPQQQNPPEPDLWDLDLEELESMVDKENQLKEQQLELVRKSVEECNIKNQLQEQKLHSLDTDIENRCKELGIKEKQLTSVEVKLQLICRDVEIKEREYEEIGGRVKERIREVGEKEEQLKLIQTKICEYDRRLRLKQEDCSWQLEMMQKLTTERDEVERKMKMEIDEQEKEIEDKVARLAVIDDLIKDRDRDLITLDMLFEQSAVAVDKFLRENEMLLSAQVAKIGECNKEIKVKEEKLGMMEKLIDTMQKKKDSIKAMREKIIQLLQEVESSKKDNDLKKGRDLKLEKKEEQFQVVVKKLELSKRDNELLKERKLEVEEREKRLLEEVKYIESINKRYDRRLTEYELKERRFKERVRELDSREEGCDERMNTLLSKEKQLKVRFKELESNEKDFEERSKKLLGLKEKELEERTRELWSKEIELEEQTRELGSKEKKLEEQTRELRSKEKKLEEQTRELGSKEKKLEEQTRELESKEKQHKEEFEELKSEVIKFECNMKKFLLEANGRVKEQESEKNKFEAQVREHELKEKLYEVRVQELSLKEKKFEIQVQQLESKEKGYEERLKELASKEKQHVAQHSQAPQALDNESSPTTDGSNNLQLLLNEQTNEPELYVNGTLVDLQSTSDPAKLVLVVIQKPVIRLDQKGDKGAIIEERHIFLLEQLMRISPDIKSHVRKEAMKLALDLKANMGANTENSLVVLGFLLLLSAYGLVSSFDEDEVFKHFEFAAQHRQAVELFRTLGFVDKIADFVQNLINKQRIIEAVRFICAYKLAAKFQPVHLLNQHMQKQRQRSKKSCKGTKQKVEAREEEIAELRNVLECVLDNNIGSQNLVKVIQERIHKLERQKGSLAASNPNSKSEEVQQQQAKPNKRANEAITYYPSQGSDYSKRSRTVTPPPPPILHPQFHHRHVLIPCHERERGIPPPTRPIGIIPGQFSYYPPQDYYSHAHAAASTIGVGRYGDHAGARTGAGAGSDYLYRSGPYPPYR